MENMDLKSILAKVEPIVREAGLSALSLQENLEEVRFKSPKDLVTSADLSSEKILVEGISKLFPEHRIRTEEAGVIENFSKDASLQWVIDPVDGTINFSRRIPFWGVSVALLQNQKPIVAICYLPRLGEMFMAYKNGGCFLNGKRIFVSNTSAIEKAIVSNGDFNVGNAEKIRIENLKNFSEEAKSCMRVKCMGSAVAEGTFLASGRLDGFVMTMSYPWDIAGISLLIEEANGKVSRIDGSPLTYTDGEQVLFSNGILHQDFLEILKRAKDN